MPNRYASFRCNPLIRSCALALFFVAGLAHSQDAKPVSFVCPGARLGVAVRDLATASGVQLDVHPTMADAEVVAIRVKDAPLKEVMDRIAKAVDGRWELSGSTWTLGIDSQARARKEEARVASRLALLRKQVRARLSPPKKVGQVQEEHLDAVDMPGEKAVFQVVSTLDLRLLASMPENGRIVFSTIPNRLQRGFRVPAEIIGALVKAHNDEVASQGETEVTDSEAQKLNEYFDRFGLNQKKTRIDEAPYKALLVVERGGSMMGGGGLQLTLRLYSSKGAVLLSEESNLFLDDRMADELVAEPEGPIPDPTSEKSSNHETHKQEPPKQDQGPKVQWNPIVDELRQRLLSGAMMGLSANAGSKPWTKEAKEALGNPDKQEPLSYLLGDGLVQVAEWKKQNLVACLPDEAIEAMDSKSPSTCLDVLGMVEGSRALSSVTEGGWWSLSPTDPVAARASRTNRPLLGGLIRKALVGGEISLDDLAAYAQKSPPPMESPLGMIYLFSFYPSIIRVAFLPQSWDYLRLWGTLSATQKTASPSATRIAFGGMSPAQTAIANRILFGAQPQLRVGNRNTELDDLGSFGMMITMGFGEGRADKDYREEPTEVMPNGLPSNGLLSVLVQEDFAFKPSMGGMDSAFGLMMGNMGSEDVAMYRTMAERMAGQPEAPFPVLDKLTVGKRKNITLEFNVAQDVRAVGRLADDSFSADAQAVPMAQLPANIKARLDQAAEKIKKLNLPFFDPGMFGRPPQPPPAR